MKKRKNYFGASFIEILIIIALIGVMTSVVFVEMSSSRVKNELSSAARELTADIGSLKQSALSGTIPLGMTDTICGHGLNIHRSRPNQYNLFVITKTGAGADCRGGYNRYYSTGDQYKNVTFDDIAPTVTTNGGVLNMYFQVPDGKLYIDNVEATGDTEITLTKDTTSCSITVSKTGEVISNDC